MKKLLAITFILAMALTLFISCDGNNSGGNGNNGGTSQNDNIDPTNEPNGGGSNNDENTEGKLVSGDFSLEYPNGWEHVVNGGDPEAHDPNSDAFIQLTVMGTSAETYFELMRAEDYTEVTIGGYTFKTTDSAYGTGMYVYEHSSGNNALITVYQIDSDTLDAVLASFKVS